MPQHAVSNGRLRPVRITEVAPRDGLQNERAVLTTEMKVAFINALSRTGVDEIEAGAFVAPQSVPQMADSDDVFRKIERRAGVTYSALVPNERGLERARAASVRKIAVFTAASESFTKRNIHATIEESLERFRPVVSGARRDGIAVRGYISTAWFCPFEGRVPPARVVEVMMRLLDLGVDEVSLGDTVGRASPTDVRTLLDIAVPKIGRHRLSLHLHDTYAMAVANVLAAWEDYAIESFDGSAGGVGGCPYAPGASGNVPTEEIVHALKASGGVVAADEWQLAAAAQQLGRVLDHPLPSRLARVLRRGADEGSAPEDALS